jgi:hypothetical protein
MMENMWRHDLAKGVIEKVTSEYVVVKWDNTPGHWHYTKEQSQRLEFIND